MSDDVYIICGALVEYDGDTACVVIHDYAQSKYAPSTVGIPLYAPFLWVIRCYTKHFLDHAAHAGHAEGVLRNLNLSSRTLPHCLAEGPWVAIIAEKDTVRYLLHNYTVGACRCAALWSWKPCCHS